MKLDYTPREGSLPYRVCAYFRAQADEELSRDDIVLKFDVTSAHQVDQQLATAVAAGLLTRVVRERGSATYLAGPALAAKMVLAATPSAPRTNGAFPSFHGSQGKPKRRAPTLLPPIDAANVGISADLPAPVAFDHLRNRSPWHALLERMTKPGQHSEPIPKIYAKQLRTSAARWGKQHGAKFAVHEVEGGKVRIWRTA